VVLVIVDNIGIFNWNTIKLYTLYSSHMSTLPHNTTVIYIVWHNSISLSSYTYMFPFYTFNNIFIHSKTAMLHHSLFYIDRNISSLSWYPTGYSLFNFLSACSFLLAFVQYFDIISKKEISVKYYITKMHLEPIFLPSYFFSQNMG